MNDIAAALDISQSLGVPSVKTVKARRGRSEIKKKERMYTILWMRDMRHVVDIFEEALKHIMHRMEEGNHPD